MKKVKIYILIITLMFSAAACSTQAEKNDNETITVSLSKLASVVKESVDFPAMTEYTEQGDIETFSGADFEAISEIILYQQALTVHLVEIIIVSPKENNMSQVMDFLQNRRAKLIDDVAFYPGQEAAAQATVIGNEYGVAYLICHEDAAVAQEALVKFMDENI